MIKALIDGGYVSSSLPEDLAGPHPHANAILSLFDMLHFKAESFLRISSAIGKYGRIVQPSTNEAVLSGNLEKVYEKIDSEGEQLSALLSDVEEELQALGLQASLTHLEKIDQFFKRDHKVLGDLQELLGQLQAIIEAEMKSQLFFAISPNSKFYYEKSQFTQKTMERFLDAQGDMIEAGKCFALDRWTACVFHLMRITEAGLQELARFVSPEDFASDEDFKKGWDKVIRKIDSILKDTGPSAIERYRGKREFLAEASAQMYAVNRAWRTRTMHLQNKYTEEEAREIFVATQGLIRFLSEKLPE